MPTDEELDAMAEKLRPGSVRPMTFKELAADVRIVALQLAIAAKHAKAVCDLAEDSANYMARIVM